MISGCSELCLSLKKDAEPCTPIRWSAAFWLKTTASSRKGIIDATVDRTRKSRRCAPRADALMEQRYTSRLSLVPIGEKRRHALRPFARLVFDGSLLRCEIPIRKLLAKVLRRLSAGGFPSRKVFRV